jgi:hypothetical protein
VHPDRLIEIKAERVARCYRPSQARRRRKESARIAMPFSSRNVQVSARILVKRYGAGALRRAETQVLRMERTRAFAAARTWRQLSRAIRAILDGTEESRSRAGPKERSTVGTTTS